MTMKHLARITTRWTRHFFSDDSVRVCLSVLGLGVVVALGLGCGSSGGPRAGNQPRGTDDQVGYRKEASKVFGDVGGLARPGAWPAEMSGAPTWGVLIAQFPATLAGEERANTANSRVRTRGGLPTAFLERRGSSIALIVGRHATVEDARRELSFVRNIELENAGSVARPYQTAVVSLPWVDESAGTMPEYDLRSAKARFGKGALYTLQVGIYGRLDRSRPDPDEMIEYRQAAEQAVAQLRADGEDAFYYHGPTSSIVVVGIYGEKDHDPTTGVRGESDRLRTARERHPNNLLNGKGIMETRRDTRGRAVESLQRSALVAIPG